MTWFRPLLLTLLLAAAAGVAAVLALSPDPKYTAHEWIRQPNYWQYDDLIRAAAKRYRVDPALVKAVAWRESSFDPRKVGGAGERGLMQVTEGAAQDWVRAEKMTAFAPTDLFDPKVNLEAGSWYLARASEKWKNRNDPLPFALGEYNAGRGRVQNWIEKTGRGENATAAELMQAIDFPTTRKYVETVLARRQFYRARGRL